MKITGVELRRMRLPLVSPFRTSFGTETHRELLMLRVVTPEAEGWAECVALPEPVYSPEYLAGAEEVLKTWFLPTVFGLPDLDANKVGPALRRFKGHQMAKAALETAVLDAELRARGQSLAAYLGATKDRVPSGVSVGIMDSVPQLLEAVEGYLAEGYLRIKLKIEPGWDLAPVAAVRSRFGEDLLLQVDANTAYTLTDARHLARLDEYDLLLIEQPLAEEDLRQHAELAAQLRTPVCLDESVVSAQSAADAISLGSCSVINIKPGRVGGYLESRRVHDLCQAHGVAAWCGGMLETGIGRAANVAFAALPGCTLPGDTSASRRYYTEDITEPFVLVDGHLPVPTGPGIGVDPIPDALAAFTTRSEWVKP
ncbi:O-succinylbenzoate synthase [Crossiella equi]|uniref:o-succinylbenzoate synthase n=1 Tax=Crossiella equi TaxID=130796 RepID=A0ABS5AQG1_9PSEU|nr:o-succinylbenzoate synthase [Crossiella equi]MBP2478807.1 O-succinylbenzoate synthase [Crossiella equi]